MPTPLTPARRRLFATVAAPAWRLRIAARAASLETRLGDIVDLIEPSEPAAAQ